MLYNNILHTHATHIQYELYVASDEVAMHVAVYA